MTSTTTRPERWRGAAGATAGTTGPTRRWRVGRVATVAATVVALVGALGYGWLRSTSGVKAQGVPCAEVAMGVAEGVTTPEGTLRDGICSTLDSLVTTWDAGDAAAYGAAFTEDASYVAFTGTVYLGRDDIVAGHEALFSGLLEGTRLSATYLSIRVTGETTALVVSRGDTYEGDAPGKASKVQTFALVREDDGVWRVSAFQNTQRRPVMERIQFLMDPGSVPAAER